MICVACGLGTNTAAVLVGLHENGIRPDLLVFADTGAEMPHTYAYIGVLREWLARVGFPDLTIVRDANTTILQDCEKRKALPAVAYGFKTCSQRFKVQPQDKFMNSHEPAREVWARGEQITKVIGYDADEPQRAKDYIDTKYRNWYPLIEWGWGRDECVEAIKRAGLPQPGKSSCFICPNMRQSEIRAMAAKYPELADRAIAIEKNANLSAIAGLGRNWSWGALLSNPEMFDFDDGGKSMPCGCYDGGGDD